MLGKVSIKKLSNSISKNQIKVSNSKNNVEDTKERSKYTKRQKEKNNGKKLAPIFKGRDGKKITISTDTNLISEDSSSTTSSALSTECEENLSNLSYPKILNSECGKRILSNEVNAEEDVAQDEAQRKKKITDNMMKPNQLKRHCYFEIPVGVKEGTKLFVQWPDGQRFFINCPKAFDKHKPQHVCVVAPGEDPPQFPLNHSPEQSKSISRRKRKRKKADTEEWLWEEYEKKSSRIGRQYQIKHLPSPNEHEQKKTDHKQYESVWDPRRAGEAISNGENIDGFLRSLKGHHQELGMIALHEGDYSVPSAKSYIKNTISTNTDFHEWTVKMKRAFHNTITETYMDMRTISSKVGKSVCACLVYYYGTFRQSRDYKKYLMKLNNEYDECVICGDGGKLICCDSCNKPFHLQCLKPPLDKVPEGDWFCLDCTNFHKKKISL